MTIGKRLNSILQDEAFVVKNTNDNFVDLNQLTEFFRRVWAADNFPSMCNDIEENGKALFQIVNTEPSYLPENTGFYFVVKKTVWDLWQKISLHCILG